MNSSSHTADQKPADLFRRVRDGFSTLGSAWKLIYNASPGWTLAWMAVLALQGLLPAALVVLTRWLVDSLTLAIGIATRGPSLESARDAALAAALLPAGLLAGCLLLTEWLGSAAEWVRTVQSELLQDAVSDQVHDQAAKLDLAFYESSDFFDRLHRVAGDAASRPLALLESAGSLAQNGLALFAIGAVLVPYGAWLPLALLAGMLPALWASLHTNRRYYRWWLRTTADRRWVQYYDAMLTHRDVAAELRLFDLSTHFRSAYRSLRQRLRAERLVYIREQSLARLLAGTAALAVVGLIMLWMGRGVLAGALTLGDLALFYQAFTRSQGLMRTTLNSLSQIYNNGLFLGNLFEFMALQPTVTDPQENPQPLPARLQQGISFRQVSFRYPGNGSSLRPALQAFDLDIPAGQVTAIVGANGAGKSTLLKLLCRFYDPDTGSIEIDGVDLRKLSLDVLRRRITVLFQFPVHYHAPAGQNIALGDLATRPSREAIEDAARRAGAHSVIAGLPRGYDTLLGKWYADGEELSAGEWQRIALARAYLRQAEILILDEPTSFMDSWAEIEWFDRFRELAVGRTAIVITHRFTIAMRADIIHVMNTGRLVESGTHAELLALGGLYAQSWAAQTQAQFIAS